MTVLFLLFQYFSPFISFSCLTILGSPVQYRIEFIVAGILVFFLILKRTHFFVCLYFVFWERVHGGRGRERGEEEPQAGSMSSTSTRWGVGLSLTTQRLWPEQKPRGGCVTKPRCHWREHLMFYYSITFSVVFLVSTLY